MSSPILRPAAQPLGIHVEIVEKLSPLMLTDLCEAADAAIEAGGGFGWITPPPRASMERYWQGVLAVPERHLIVAFADRVVCGAAQLTEPSRHNEAQSFAAQIISLFVAPWARGRGAGKMLLDTAEKLALDMKYDVLNLDVRATHVPAISLYEANGYHKWGENPLYARVNGQAVTGYFYSKILRQGVN